MPYLVIKHTEPKEDLSNAQDDAERLFFNRLRARGGSIHVINGNEQITKLLVMTGCKNLDAIKSQTPPEVAPVNVLIQDALNKDEETPAPTPAP